MIRMDVRTPSHQVHVPATILGRGGAGGAILSGALLFAVLIAVVFVVADGTVERPYALPGALGLSAAVVLPIVYASYRGTCDVFSPVVFAGWGYFFPAFALSGIFLAGGVAGHEFSAVPDPAVTLPRTQALIAVGYLSLLAGFMLPWTQRAAVALAARLPRMDWEPSRLTIPGILLLAVGIALQFLAFWMGLIGYQPVGPARVMDAAVRFMGLTMTVAFVVLWCGYFRTPHAGYARKFVVGILLATILVMVVLTGSRATPVMMTMMMGVAFWYSREHVRFRSVVLFGGLLVLALAVGMLYGSTFRIVKAGETRASVDEQMTQASSAMSAIWERGGAQNVAFVLARAAERMDITSSVAVVVGRHEELRPRERELGLANNIWTSAWTAFIPRVLWPDKPAPADLRKYGLLYHDNGSSSPAITYVGDLLRNFGPWGVAAGMGLLGVLLRFLYSALLDGVVPPVGRVAAYYVLLSGVSYEGLYGLLLPELMRVGFVVALSLAFLGVTTMLPSRQTVR